MLYDTVTWCRAPWLLTLTPQQLSSNFRGLLAGLRIDAHAVVDMVRQDPRLLLMEQETSKQRLDAMMYMMYMPRKQVSPALWGSTPGACPARRFGKVPPSTLPCWQHSTRLLAELHGRVMTIMKGQAVGIVVP